MQIFNKYKSIENIIRITVLSKFCAEIIINKKMRYTLDLYYFKCALVKLLNIKMY